MGRVYTTTDENKYIKSQIILGHIYLRCVLFRSGCKGTGRLNIETNLIAQLKQHNHNIEAYQTDIYQIKTRCKTIVKITQINLRKVFIDVTRNDPSACDISFRECESSLYRARRTLQPKIPHTAEEFCEPVPTTAFGQSREINIFQSSCTIFATMDNFCICWKTQPPFKPLSNDCKNPNFIAVFVSYKPKFYTQILQFWKIYVVIFLNSRHWHLCATGN